MPIPLGLRCLFCVFLKRLVQFLLTLLCVISDAENMSNVLNSNTKNSTRRLVTMPSDKSLSVKNELNILLLGESGVGKTTWINGFVNFLHYKSLEEVVTNGAVFLIPSSFTMSFANGESVNISTGTDKYEYEGDGQSATQYPKTYVFRTSEGVLRLIDTPGIGDTRGIVKDEENFRNILDHIATLDAIHGICILLKPGESRLGIMFEYCIKGLLTQLHKDACRNIVFCCTKCRGTDYSAADTLVPLRKLLMENNIKIDLNDTTIYCIDNEAVRYLAAIKQGIVFEEWIRKGYFRSWTKAAIEFERLLVHFTKTEPHVVRNTLSVNDTRRLFVSLTKSLVELSMMIQTCIGNLEKYKQDLLDKDMDKTGLLQNLHIPHFKQAVIQFKRPVKVCTSEKCLRYITDENRLKRCKYDCKRDSKSLQTLQMFRFEKRNCTHCGCDRGEHEVITYEVVFVEIMAKDMSIQRQLNDNELIAQFIKEHVHRLEIKKRKLDDEQATITSVMATFSSFLKVNSITPYNDAIGRYIDVSIRNASNETAVCLEKIRQQYQDDSKIIEEAMQKQNSCQKSLTPIEIEMHILNLFSLENVGTMIKECAQIAEAAELDATKLYEAECPLKSSHIIDKLFSKKSVVL